MCNFDLVNNNVDICQATFDEDTGNYVFECHDRSVFAYGEYTFAIRAHVFTVVKEIIFTMHLSETCVVHNPQIIADPFTMGPYEYVLGQPALRLPYNINQIGIAMSAGACGGPAVEFVAPQAFSTHAFIVDYVAMEIIVGWTDNTNLVGDYEFTFKFFYTNDL